MFFKDVDTNKLLKFIISLTFFLLIVFRLPSVYDIIFNAYKSIYNFANAKYSYDALRKNNRFFKTALEAERILPRGARIKVYPDVWGFEKVYTRYTIYPYAIIDNNWNYLIDFNNTAIGVPLDWKSQVLPSSAKVYAQPEYDFVKNKTAIPDIPILKKIFIFLFVALTIIIIGISFLSYLKISVIDGGKFYFIGASYLSGLFITTVVVLVFMLLGGALSRVNILFLWGCIFFLLTLGAKKNLLINIYALFHKRTKFDNPRKNLFEVIILITACLIIVSILAIVIFNVISSWDAVSYWVMRSKVIFYEYKLSTEYTVHNHYPVLWSLYIGIQYILLGGIHDEIIGWAVALLLLAFVSQFFGALQFLEYNKHWAWLGILLYFYIFFISTLTTGQPEASLMAFTMGISAALCGWKKYSKRMEFCILAIIMALGAGFVKLEGMVTALIIGVSIAIIYRKRLGIKNAIYIFIAFAVPLFIQISWMIFVKYSGYLSDLNHFQSAPSLHKLLLIAILFPSMFAANIPSNGVFISIIFLLLIKNVKNLDHGRKFLILVSTALILFIGAAYLGWDEELISTGSYTSSYRLFLHATPFLMLLFMSLISENFFKSSNQKEINSPNTLDF